MADLAALRQNLKKKLGNVSDRTLQRLIQQRERDTLLPRRLAILSLAADKGLSIRQYANDDDLSQLRSVRLGSAAPVALATDARPAAGRAPSRPSRPRKTAGPRPRTTKGKKVFIVHGRNTKIYKQLEVFLRSLGLEPLEWNKLLGAAGKGTPSIYGDVLTAAFAQAAAVVVLLTPDDEVTLKREFWKSGDAGYEHLRVGQARPNVLFEAGMAFGRYPNSTVLVQVGAVKPFSDVSGLHIAHLTGDGPSRRELATKLAAAGCAVDIEGTAWLTDGDFTIEEAPANGE